MRKASAPTVERHFERKPDRVRAIYGRLLAAARELGPMNVAPKASEIHFRRASAFAGIVTRRDALVLAVKSTERLASPRVSKHLRASAKRWYVYVRLESPADVDRELGCWLARSYELSG